MEYARCARCPYTNAGKFCRNEGGRYPDSCPTHNEVELISECMHEYEKSPIHEFARQASRQEGEGYGQKELGYEKVTPIKPRILEIVELAEKMHFRRLGLAFCAGLAREARIVDRFFSSRGFDVLSVICKVGQVPKEEIGIKDEEKIAIGQFEAMCNPILQAMVLNKGETEFNVLLGLCVGHDSLVLKYSRALCTVLAVKDRLLGHNPLAAVYNLDSYYRCLKGSAH